MERELLHASYDLYTNQDQSADGALHYIDDLTDSSIRVAKNYDLWDEFGATPRRHDWR